jgi:hypothetical protein
LSRFCVQKSNAILNRYRTFRPLLQEIELSETLSDIWFCCFWAAVRDKFA